MNFGTAPRELKMTVTCKACEHQYGAWRERCPTCGTATPPPPKSFNAPIVRAHVRSATECIFCQLRGAKDTCPHCEEKIHKTCLRLHVDDCAKFQTELKATGTEPMEATTAKG